MGVCRVSDTGGIKHDSWFITDGYCGCRFTGEFARVATKSALTIIAIRNCY